MVGHAVFRPNDHAGHELLPEGFERSLPLHLEDHALVHALDLSSANSPKVSR